MAESIAEAAVQVPQIEPRPFVKWIGGKRSLLPQYEPLLPTEFNHYFEPFVGGGAMFFHTRPTAARLSDMNGRLVETYRAVRDDLPGLIDRLENHREQYDRVGGESYYYRCRTRFNQPRMAAVDRAALFIFLNKTTYNGMFRENKSGGFNAPWGRRETAPALYDRAVLEAASHALQGVDVVTAGFETVLDHAKEGDFVYFDPPYVPLSATSSFTSYGKAGFDVDMQIDLARTFDILARRGCLVMLSNSDCELVRDLYAGWRIEQVFAKRSVNSKANGRGEVAEVVVCSW